MKRFIEKPASESEIAEAVSQTDNAFIKEASGKLGGEPLLPVNTSYALLLRDIFEQTEGKGNSLGEEIFSHLPPSLIYAHIMPEPIEAGAIRKEWYHLASPRDFWLAEWRFARSTPHAIRGEYNDSYHSWFGRERRRFRWW